jgi:hypothetical protein
MKACGLSSELQVWDLSRAISKRDPEGGRVCLFNLYIYYITKQWGTVTFLQKYIHYGISEIG